MGAGLVVSLLVTAVATWLLLLAALALWRPKGLDLAEARRFVPDVVRLVRGLSADDTLGRGLRLRLALLLAYLASPIDLVPDFVPVLGYADDVIVVALALRAVVRRAGSAALEAHWRGTDAGLAVVRRLAGLADG